MFSIRSISPDLTFSRASLNCQTILSILLEISKWVSLNPFFSISSTLSLNDWIWAGQVFSISFNRSGSTSILSLRLSINPLTVLILSCASMYLPVDVRSLKSSSCGAISLIFCSNCSAAAPYWWRLANSSLLSSLYSTTISSYSSLFLGSTSVNSLISLLIPAILSLIFAINSPLFIITSSARLKLNLSI